MFNTVETRWFGQGLAPVEVLTWFSSFEGVPEQQSARRDYYLRPVDGGDGLGVKMREGALEVKQRQHIHGPVRLHRRAVGLVEGWTKWRFPLENPGHPVPVDVSKGSGWLAVDKVRQLRHYQVTSEMALQITTPQAIVDSGCALELTRLQTGGNSWWTIAFEVFGDAARLYEQLLVVTSQVFETAKPPPLVAADSYGYPQWLISTVSDQ
jgi:hypothetical protein